MAESEVREVSFVSLGADKNTEARALASQTGSGSMNLRDILTGLGMPPEASDEEMQEFAARHLAQMAEDRNKKKGDDAGDDKSDNEGSGNAESASSSDSGDGGDGEDGGDEGKDLSAAVRAALAGERRRTAEINDRCTAWGWARNCPLVSVGKEPRWTRPGRWFWKSWPGETAASTA